MDLFDTLESIQNQIVSSQNKIAEFSYHRDQVGVRPQAENHSGKIRRPNPMLSDPKIQNQIRTDYQNMINAEETNIKSLKQQIKDLSQRDEERALERFKTALSEENAKFQEQFDKAVTEKQTMLEERERIANNAERQERVVEVQRPLHENNDLGKIIAAGIIGAVLFG